MAAHSILSPTTLVRPSLANTWQLFKMDYDNQMLFELIHLECFLQIQHNNDFHEQEL